MYVYSEDAVREWTKRFLVAISTVTWLRLLNGWRGIFLRLEHPKFFDYSKIIFDNSTIAITNPPVFQNVATFPLIFDFQRFQHGKWNNLENYKFLIATRISGTTELCSKLFDVE